MNYSKIVLRTNLFLFLIISTFSNAQEIGGPYTTDANTVLLMHFDGNLTNNSSLSSDGVLHGSGISFISNTLPDLGQCLKINNSDASNKSYISIPHNEALNLSQSWTIEAWFYLNTIRTNSAINPTIVSKATNGEANYFLWYHDSWGSLKGQFSNTDNKTTYTAIGNNTITTGKWFHTEYTRNNDNNTHKLVIRNENKEIIAENVYQYDVTQATPVLSVEDLLIGSLSSLDNFYFDGYIDELRISNMVRDFSYTLDKTEITSENLIIYFDTENSNNANTILGQLQNKIDFYKKYFRYNFLDHSKIFSINICKDIAEFNQFKPDGLPDFETSYLHNEILYIINPTSTAQLGYFNGFEQATMHAFAKMFVDSEYNNNASEWMKYGFARHQSGMKSTPEEIKNEVNTLGRKPTMQEMNNWDQITSFDKYAFAYTIFQYVADVYTFNNIFYRIRFENNTTNYSFRHFNTESEFEKTWHFSLDMFYLRESNLMKLQRETEHFYLYMVDEDMPEMDQWASELEEFYTRFTNDMQMTIDHKIHLSFYPAIEDFQNIEGLYDIDFGHVGEKISIDMCKFTRSYRGAPMMNSIGLAKHELTHVIHGNLEKGRNPTWLVEGLATLMPDGLYTDEIINGSTGVIKEQVNVGFSEIAVATGRYPSIDDFESSSFVEQYGLNSSSLYYMLGSVLVDYLIKSGEYLGLKNFILSDGLDYTTANFTDRIDFNDSFYSFYKENWKNTTHIAKAYNIETLLNIDGNIAESVWNLNYNIEGIYPFYQDWNNNTASYGILWDSDYLYVAVKVFDNNLVNNSTDDWNDGVQIFIDGDFNKSFEYDSYDRQFIKGWNNNIVDEKNNNTIGVLHGVQNISGGYTIEMAIPWSNLGITPANGKTIGFDIANIVNDNGNKYQLIWSGNNLNYGTTINFGELKLLLNFAPTVSDILDQTISVGGSFSTIQLDDFVSDTDNSDSEITWSYSGNSELVVSITNRIATITTPNSEWIGSETITFTATDSDGNSGSDEVVFTILNNTSLEGTLSNGIIITSSSLGYDCQYRVYTPANYNSLSDLPTIYVTDGQNYLSNSMGKMVTTLDNLIANELIKPIIAVFLDPRDPNNLLNDRRGFEYRNNINFVNYVTKELMPEIDANYKTKASASNRGIMGASYGGYNAEYFSVKASDYFNLFGMNSPYLHPNDNYDIDADLQAANLDGMKFYLSCGTSDADGKRYFDRLKGIFDSKSIELRSDIVSGGHDWGTWSSVVDLALYYFFPNSLNGNPPFISDISNQLIFEGKLFQPIKLDDFVQDSDNEDSEIIWTYSGDDKLSVVIDGNRIATVTSIDIDWFGNETILFIATDPSGNSNSDEVKFIIVPVNDPPVISGVPELIEFFSDTSFTIDVFECVSDVETENDSLICEFSVDSDSLLYTYDDRTGILTLSAEIEFGGEGNLIWSVSDSEAIVQDTIHIAVEKAVVIGIDDKLLAPQEYVLHQNYPNPFNPTTMIKYGIPEQSKIRIEVFNMLGQSVGLLVNSDKSAGYYETAWNAENLPSGIYLISIRAEGIITRKNFSQSRKALLIK